jgi:hypothetical protein
MVEESAVIIPQNISNSTNIKKRIGLGVLFGIYTQIFEVFMLESIGGHHNMDLLTFGLHTIGDIVICFGISKLKNLVNKKSLSIVIFFIGGVIINYALHLSVEDLYHNIAYFLGKHTHEGHKEIGGILANWRLLFVIGLKVIVEELSKYYIFKKNQLKENTSPVDKL